MVEENKETKIEEKNETNEHSKSSVNPWMIASVVLAVAVIVLFFMIVFNGSISGFAVKSVSGQDAGLQLTKFLNTKTNGGVEYVGYSDLGNLYEINVTYQNQTIPVYTDKSGRYFIQSAIDVTVPDPAANANTNTANTAAQAPANAPKSDKPKVELFVMSYCPFGLQAEKGILPVFKALGNKIDGEIRFVHYTMHGAKEDEENARQLCIRQEQASKYLDYLSCFTEAGDFNGCIVKTGISNSSLNTCLTSKAKDYYASDSKLSQGYGVQGSPTLIINGVEANSGRDPASYLKTICAAFNNPPSECTSLTLSSASPAAGFGTAADTSGASAAQCG